MIYLSLILAAISIVITTLQRAELNRLQEIYESLAKRARDSEESVMVLTRENKSLQEFQSRMMKFIETGKSEE